VQNYNFSANPQGDGGFFSFYQGTSSHVIPALACAVAWDLWLRLVFSVPFPLMGKDRRIKADIKGLPHMATTPPPCRPGPRAQPGQSLASPHTVSVVLTFTLDDTPPPLAVIDSLRIVESGIWGLDPQSPKRQGDANIL
jgi:hypothetical protein